MTRDPRRLEEAVDEEIRFHLEKRRLEYRARGLDDAAAGEEALRRFGDVGATTEACTRSDHRREERMATREVFRDTWRDAAIAARQLARRPVFTGVAVLTLAVGIGANTAIFSAVDHVLLRPLPYADTERVVTLWQTSRQSGETRLEVASGNFVDWTERASSFESMGLAEPYSFDLTETRPAEALDAWLVTEGWFEALGVEPFLGRGFVPSDYVVGEAADAVAAVTTVVVSHAFWMSHLGGDTGTVGTTLVLDDRAVRVVGVLPPGLEYPADTEIWAPKVFRVSESYDERLNRASGYMLAVGRLRPGVDLEQARRDMDAVAARLAAEYPATNEGVGVSVVPLRQHVLGDVRTPILVLFGAVGLVLLIACANVASLVLARAHERVGELALRAALGAGRAGLVYQMLLESLVLAVAGGLAGLLVAWAGIGVMAAWAPADLPRVDTVALDGRVLAFAAALTLLSAVLCGLAPALRLSRSGLLSPLRAGGHGGGRGREALRFQSGLVVAEIALSVVLLVGAGLLGRSFLALTANDLGFEPEGLATAQVFLWNRYPSAAERVAVARRIMDGMDALPGVDGVAAVSALPFHPTQIDGQDAFAVEGRPPLRVASTVYTTVASTDYFDVMDIPLHQGRFFTPEDVATASPVAIVNRTLARRFFPGESPVGRYATFGAMAAPARHRIVGVVGDVRPTAFDAEPRAEVYVPFAQSGWGGVTFVAEAAGHPAALVAAMRGVVADADPAQTIDHAATMASMIDDTLVARRFNLLLLGLLSAVALVLAIVGMYGLISYATDARTPEIGIRMALGAGASDVVRTIVLGALGLALAGVALGVVAALGLTRFMERMLYGVEPADPLTYLQLAALVTLVAAVAAWIPARRASRLDPGRALRE